MRRTILAHKLTWMLEGVALCSLFSCVADTNPCQADDDCETAYVCRGGSCRRFSSDAGVPAARGSDAGLPDGAPQEETDAGLGNAGAADGGGTTGAACTWLGGDTLVAEQIPVVRNVSARYTVAGSETAPVEVHVDGTMGDDGALHWDFTGTLAADRAWELRALPLDGFWFAEDFPASAYALALDVEERTFGVFEKTEEQLAMWGVVSAEEQKTELHFSPPVAVLRFPLTVGQTWQVDVEAAGSWEYNPWYQATETWRMEVQSVGVVEVPAGSFPAFHLITDREVKLPILVPPYQLEYRTWQHSFLTPCLGQVAAVTSPVNAEGPSFGEAAEFRRMGLP